jgi:hypothetical protein
MAHAAHAPIAALSGYTRRQPEETLLHRTLSKHWPAFVRRAEEHGGLPDFVVREVEDYLTCGILEHGCVVTRCRDCGHERVVGLSCKHRGWCPSCCGRRMADSAAHLSDSVLPEVPIRQWVVTLPWQVRALVGYDRRLCAAVFDAFAKELMALQKRRAKRYLGLGSVSEAHTGTVTFVQRFDSALRLDPHGHVLTPDGVWVRGDEGGLEFHALTEPTLAEVAELAERTAARLERVFEAHGKSFEEPCDDSEQLWLEHPALASCYQAATAGRQLLSEHPGAPVLRVMGPLPRGKGAARPALVAEARGVNVHAERVVDGRDRAQLERLCRYLARPPLSHDRLSELPDGRLRLAFKKPWRDGTEAVVLTPMDLIARLCALTPPPRMHLTRFHGVFAPAAKLRPDIVPRRTHDPELDPPQQLSLFDPTGHRPAPPAQTEPTPSPAGRHPWAWLLRRVFAVDLTVCERCAGRVRIVEVAITHDAIARVLARHGLGPQPPPVPQRPLPGQLRLPGVPIH